jgi:hypothetical protein
MKNKFFDKWNNIGTYSVKLSNYFEVYEHILTPFLQKKITLVEIGILNGGSLHFWREVFGDDARIIGIDLNENVKIWEKEGFEIFIGDQGDSNFWKKFFDEVGNVDIVIDDGSHTYYEQINTLINCVPNINHDGLFITEDVHSSFQNKYGYPSKYSFVNFTKLISETLHSKFEGTDNKKKLIPDNVKNKIFSLEHFSSVTSIKIKDNQGNPTKLVFNNGKKYSATHEWSYIRESKIKKIMIFFAKKLKFLKRIKFVNLIVIKLHSILDLYLRKKQNKKCKMFFKNEFKE